jgi:hypothetical protein
VRASWYSCGAGNGRQAARFDTEAADRAVPIAIVKEAAAITQGHVDRCAVGYGRRYVQQRELAGIPTVKLEIVPLPVFDV